MGHYNYLVLNYVERKSYIHKAAHMCIYPNRLWFILILRATIKVFLKTFKLVLWTIVRSYTHTYTILFFTQSCTKYSIWIYDSDCNCDAECACSNFLWMVAFISASFFSFRLLNQFIGFRVSEWRKWWNGEMTIAACLSVINKSRVYAGTHPMR